MKPLFVEQVSSLIRTGSIHKAWILPYPAIDGGGWTLRFDHSDHLIDQDLHTKRGGVRIFKTSDAAIKVLLDVHWHSPVTLVIPKE